MFVEEDRATLAVKPIEVMFFIHTGVFKLAAADSAAIKDVPNHQPVPDYEYYLLIAAATYLLSPRGQAANTKLLPIRKAD